MNIIGIICEYNPFHNGHVYHLQKIKELFPDSLIILVLNGYFTQRGDVSIISKQDKVKIALQIGIDLVIELPFIYGTQSADIFALASIKILNLLKAQYIVFGSECNDINKLEQITDYMLKNKKQYDLDVKAYLNKGMNYPTAMAKALNIAFDFKANDLLGISYLKAIKKIKSSIKPITIKRTNEYLDTLSNDSIISATNIREKLKNNIDITNYVPKNIQKYIQNISLDDYFPYLKYKIITEIDLSIYLDVDEGIENRLKKVINECQNLDELIEKVKSKRYTYNKIQRMLVHILVGLTKKDNKKVKIDCLKVLGLNEKGQKYLHSIKKEINVPFNLKNSYLTFYELKAAMIYDLIAKNNNFKFESEKKPIISEK